MIEGRSPERRIIPARARFTGPATCLAVLAGDHPRSRGVYEETFRARARDTGSSPLARGLHLHAQDHRGHPGIIPARAGFTGRVRSRSGRPRDHPRSRGVYDFFFKSTPNYYGSSPLARGLPDTQQGVVARTRIIPARAGFTWRRGWTPTPWRDHPRSRGVYTTGTRGPATPTGSSPLARGLLWKICVIRAMWGIIPARAGFTHDRTAPRRRPRDHPRSRGVYVLLLRAGTASPGSSPLARGLRRRRVHEHRHHRIIPARAGFTVVPGPNWPRKRIIPARAGFTPGPWTAP